MSDRCSAVLSAVHGTVKRELVSLRKERGSPLSLLDVGCWDGAATSAYRGVLGGTAAGIEVYPGPAAKAAERGIDVASIDLEQQSFPWPGERFDVVVVNQVFEHLKNIWLPMSEIARVMAPGGTLVFSVPNLGSFHNRILLALGLQPSSIRTFGPHVRGYTFGEAKRFIEYGSYFQVVAARGVGFYPLPIMAARWVASLWVAGSHTPVFVARKTGRGSRFPWSDVVGGPEAEQTFYSPAG
jgi:SAM-dependent methyltransferase